MSDAKETKKPLVYVIYYSTWGHMRKMAEAVAKGVEEGGATVKIFRVAETLPEEVLKKMHAAPPADDHPVIDPTGEEVLAADAYLFGVPTRYGQMSAQFKAFWDATGGHWLKGAFVGKLASVFFSTGTQGGGQETTALTFYTCLVHHGFLIAPIGYSNPKLMNLDEIHGGSPYGAGTFAGPTGARQPSELELDVATHQGKLVAGYAAKFAK